MGDSSPGIVLIAEDDPVFRHLLNFTIRKHGYNVVAVNDGQAAWERLQSRDVNLLITDHQMPRCSGLELLERIKQADSKAVVDSDRLVDTAILCTAKGLEIDRQRIREQFGLLGVMGKPFSPMQLIQLVNQHFKPSPTSDASETRLCGNSN